MILSESAIDTSVMYVFGTWNFFVPPGVLKFRGRYEYLISKLVEPDT